jgi:hypothetical protein
MKLLDTDLAKKAADYGRNFSLAMDEGAHLANLADVVYFPKTAL